jgi:hypothetical protein
MEDDVGYEELHVEECLNLDDPLRKAWWDSIGIQKRAEILTNLQHVQEKYAAAMKELTNAMSACTQATAEYLLVVGMSYADWELHTRKDDNHE